MPVSRQAFSAAVSKSLKSGIRPSAAAVKKIQKQIGLYGTKVADSKVKEAFRALKEKGLLGARATAAGEFGFKQRIKKEAAAAAESAAAAEAKQKNVKSALRSRLMEEERTRGRITEALERGKDGVSSPAAGRAGPKNESPREQSAAAPPLAPTPRSAPRVIPAAPRPGAAPTDSGSGEKMPADMFGEDS